MSDIHCECGRVTGVACAWEGDEAETVIMHVVQEYLRDSYRALGRGVSGTGDELVLRVERSCAQGLLETEGEWAEIVS